MTHILLGLILIAILVPALFEAGAILALVWGSIAFVSLGVLAIAFWTGSEIFSGNWGLLLFLAILASPLIYDRIKNGAY